MKYAVCSVPLSPLRNQPYHNVEMISQQLFGERCIILETVTGWAKIKCEYDGYEGWCQDSHLQEIDAELFESRKLTAGWVNEIYYDGEKIIVPFGSSLETFRKGKANWQNKLVTYNGEFYNPDKEKINKKNIQWIARKYLNTSYLWGGRSVYGIDCSGFTQAVYKFLNICLPRDSWQQAEQGETIKSLDETNCGDLCFFDNEEGRITHVGILLNQHKIIHSLGKVRIDEIDNIGITNNETQLRTHKLKMIKRYF